MTPNEFAACASRTRLRDRSLDAARRVLVDGLGKSEVARLCELSTAAVWAAVARIEREHKGRTGAPLGWSVVTVCVPVGEAEDEIRAIERREWRAAGLFKA